MSENAATQTEEQKPKLTVDEQASLAIKTAKSQNKALNELVKLDIRNYLGLLNQTYRKKQDVTAYRERKLIIESFERAILLAFDYGADNNNIVLKEAGDLAHVEANMAAHMARLKETGMLIMAGKMAEQEKELQENNTQETKENTNE